MRQRDVRKYQTRWRNTGTEYILIKQIWTCKGMPRAWKNVIIILIHKKDLYRTFALLDFIYKICATWLKNDSGRLHRKNSR